MCRVLYIAADASLELVPDRSAAPLSVRPIESSEEAVRRQFTKPHVYFIGAHPGCSCGFSYGFGADVNGEGRESVRELHTYLGRALASLGVVELYACWNGEEAEPRQDSLRLTLPTFSADAPQFEFGDRTFMVVVSTTNRGVEADGDRKQCD